MQTRSTSWACRTRAGLLAAMMLAVVMLAAACHSGSPGADATSPAPPAGGSGQGGGASQVAAAQAFASCMRSHGVPSFPDPDSSGRFLLPGSVQNAPRFTSAAQACQHLLPNGLSNGAGGGSNTSQAVKFAQCMRSHGVPNFPDPVAGGGISIPAGVDPNSPQFQSAVQACQAELPGRLVGQQP